jgi:hypothetical protein
VNGVYFAEGSNLRSEVGGGGGVGASVRDSSPELHSLRPYILVLPPGGEVDLIDFRIAGVISSVSAAITSLHSGDEWVFCVPWHQQYMTELAEVTPDDGVLPDAMVFSCLS